MPLSAHSQSSSEDLRIQAGVVFDAIINIRQVIDPCTLELEGNQ